MHMGGVKDFEHVVWIDIKSNFVLVLVLFSCYFTTTEYVHEDCNQLGSNSEQNYKAGHKRILTVNAKTEKMESFNKIVKMESNVTLT